MKILRFFANASTFIALVFLVGGFFGSWHPALDSLSHFRHFLIGAVFLGVWFSAAFGFVRLATFSVLAIGAALILTFPHLPLAEPSVESVGGLRIVQF
ncbi:MAG: hypothetical protein ACRCU5_12470, partial [Rhizobiaceae bacterium]